MRISMVNRVAQLVWSEWSISQCLFKMSMVSQFWYGWLLLYDKYGQYGQLVSMICQCSSVLSVFGWYGLVS